ncbi:MAG: ATP-binding protein [Raineya sp.]
MQTDLQTLRKLIRQGEGLHTEFKLKTTHPEKIVREIVAFANTDGGLLLIGVSDDKQLLGAKFPDEDEYVIEKAIKEYCSPPINYTLERIPIAEESEREILLFHIEKSQEAPHYIIKGDDKGKVYVRVADRSIQASKEMRSILKEQKKHKAFRFNYGEKEQKLMSYLAIHSAITVAKFAEIASIAPKTASRTLVLLCLANVLRIQASEEADLFVLADNLEVAR